MSFGLGVGDIILTSQLAYKLYLTVTTGRRSAPKHLKELADVLFSLRCALDHLSKTAKDIVATISERQDANAAEIQRKLGTMVDSCSGTLQELDSVLTKYRTVAGQGEDVDIGDAEGAEPAVETSTRSSKNGSMARLKENVRVNWMKIRWDVERGSLMEYRVKLQSHTDAINIVLNTFVWSTTCRIEVDGKLNAEKMWELQHQTLESNKSLQRAVQDVHRSLVSLKRAPSPPSPPSPKYPRQTADIMHVAVSSLPTADIEMPHHNSIHSARPYFKPLASRAVAQKPKTITDSNSSSVGPLAIRQRHKDVDPLPAAIVKLNIKRQSTGSEEFRECRKRYFVAKPPSKPSFLTLEVPSIPQLHDGVTYILGATPQITAGQPHLDGDRKNDIIRWTQALDHLLNSWTAEPKYRPSGPKETKQARQNEMVDLLVVLNGAVEKADDRTKRLFYQATERAGIDAVLDKFQVLSRSVRAMKETEEFQDAREEWTGIQNGAS